jgi:RNA recognition motif-containing protein
MKDTVMGKKIYVGNLSYDTSDAGLADAFGAYGKVMSARTIVDRDSGRSKGFAFVEMSTDDEARNAITGLNGTSLDGRQIKVNEAMDKPRTDRSDYRY